jgi:hypothetical protein
MKGDRVSNEIQWKRINTGYSIRYEGSNGAVIKRHGIGSKVWHGRDRQGGNKGYYYDLNDKGYYTTLKSAKAVGETL